MNENDLKAIVDLENLSKKTVFKRYEPSEDVKDIIELFWSVSWDLPSGEIIEQKILPNPHVNIVHYGDGTYVEGVVKSYFNYHLEGQGEILGVKFKIGGFKSMASISAAELTNKKIPIVTLLPDNYHELTVLNGIDAKIKWFENCYKSHNDYHEKAHLADGIINDIKENKSIMHVDQICERHTIGKRRLQRLFNEYVGVNPKWVIRMYRLQEIKMIVENRHKVDWASLAYDLGYSDQAHMIKDFKSIVGMTPKQYKEKRRKQ